MAQTTFSSEYMISLIIALLAYYWANSLAQNSALWLKLLVGLFAGYISLLILNNLMPNLNKLGNEVNEYVLTRTYSGINNMSYIYIFPPLFAILIIFLVLLYNGNLG